MSPKYAVDLSARMSLNFSSLTTKNPIGDTVKPPPVPPAIGKSAEFLFAFKSLYSPPPETNPMLTLEIGITTLLFGIVIAFPITQLTSIILRIFSKDVLIKLSILLSCFCVKFSFSFIITPCIKFRI